MNRRTVLACGIVGVMFTTAVSRAQDLVTEVVGVGFRDAGKLADVLRPLVPPPGSVSGFADKLIIKTTPANLAELKGVLASLDKAPANLLVSVRYTLDAEIRRDLTAAHARLRAGSVSADLGRPRAAGGGAAVNVRSGDVAAGVRVERSVSTRQGNETQTLRVLEGKEAFIRNGESVPVGERSVVVTGAGVAVSEGVRYEEYGSGFFVKPRLNGDRVTLDIRPSSRRRRGDGSAAVQGASTTVSAGLGEWLQLGGVDTTASTASGNVGSSRTLSTRRDGAIYVKVERLE